MLAWLLPSHMILYCNLNLSLNLAQTRLCVLMATPPGPSTHLLSVRARMCVCVSSLSLFNLRRSIHSARITFCCQNQTEGREDGSDDNLFMVPDRGLRSTPERHDKDVVHFLVLPVLCGGGKQMPDTPGQVSLTNLALS